MAVIGSFKSLYNLYMKSIFILLATLVIGATTMAQSAAHERAVVKNDLDNERIKRHEVARDLLRGQPEEARIHHRAAAAYHRRAIAHARQAQRRDMIRHERYHRHHRHYVRHHYRRHHTTVVIRN